MKAWRKYWAFARIAASEAATERGDLYGRALFFAVILGVFSALWRAVAESGMPLGARQDQLVWYLAATEWILLSTPARHLEIQEEVRRGDVAYQLSRPVSYPRAALAQFGGGLKLLLFTLIPAGFVAYVPARVARGTGTVDLACMLGGTLGYLWLARSVFKAGLRRYSSGSRFGVFG